MWAQGPSLRFTAFAVMPSVGLQGFGLYKP